MNVTRSNCGEIRTEVTNAKTIDCAVNSPIVVSINNCVLSEVK